MDREHPWQLPGLDLAHPTLRLTAATERPRTPSWPTKNHDTSGRHVDGIIEAWHGPVIALIACECGERKGLMWLQAWLGQRLNYRIYALSLLPPMSNTAFKKSLQSTSCQLDRAGQELEHLISVSHSPSFVWADLSRGHWRPVIESLSLPPAFDDWRSGLSQQSRWQGYLEASASTTVMS